MNLLWILLGFWVMIYIHSVKLHACASKPMITIQVKAYAIQERHDFNKQ
jgi:hypothetical protein